MHGVVVGVKKEGATTNYMKKEKLRFLLEEKLPFEYFSNLIDFQTSVKLWSYRNGNYMVKLSNEMLRMHAFIADFQPKCASSFFNESR